MNTAFTIWEADFSIYIEQTTGGYSGSPLFSGGCAEKIDIERRYERMAIRSPGYPFARQYAQDESHAVKIENVWSWSDGEIPDWSRWDRYVLTFVWYDEDKRAWAKVSFHGVTLPEDGIGGQNAIMQSVRFMAEQRTPIKTGTGDRPDLMPIEMPAEVWYVSASERRRLYLYDDDLMQFDAIDSSLLASRATLSIAAGECDIRFGSGAPVLTANAAALTASDFLGVQTFVDTLPKLEFWRGPFRVASVGSDGTVAANDIFERSTDPDNAGDLVIKDGSSWLFSIGRTGIYAPQFVET